MVSLARACRRVRWPRTAPPLCCPRARRSARPNGTERSAGRTPPSPSEIVISSVRRLLASRFAGIAFVAPAFVLASASDEFDLVTLIFTIVLLVICLGIHEAAHAWVAWKCGDPTAKDLGRITLNPIPHIDPFMTIVLPAIGYATTGFIFGGAKPVPVNFHRLRHPWRDMSLVALAGPASNLVLALIFLVAFKIFVTTGWYNGAAPVDFMRQDDLLPRILWRAVEFNVLLTVFNLVPIPPLDGSRIMAWLLPEEMRDSYVRLERWGLMIVIGLLFLSPAFNRLINHSVDGLIGFLVRVVSLGGAW